jgi:hypothetical protein
VQVQHHALDGGDDARQIGWQGIKMMGERARVTDLALQGVKVVGLRVRVSMNLS